MAPVEKKYKYTEDDQEKTCIWTETPEKTQWMEKMRAHVPTYSFHLGSTSEGRLFFHKDFLTEDGKPAGEKVELQVHSYEEVAFEGKITVSPPSDELRVRVFPLDNGLVISSSGSDKVVEFEGTGKFLSVSYRPEE